jgi:hypothetical protein
MDWHESWGNNPAIRLQPSEPFAGSSLETDRIIHHWRHRIFNLVEQTNEMTKDLCEISWKGSDEPYPYCNFFKLIDPPVVGRDMRRFTDEACHVLLQALASDEIVEEAYWPDHRKLDARDIREWLQRWGTWLPDEEGQFQFWSIFMPYDAIEALYRYVHALVHEYYFEILELHMEWEARQELVIEEGESLPNLDEDPPESIIYWHPRLILDGDCEFTLTTDNAEELRDWAYNAFMQWGKLLDRDRKEALVEAACQADELCPKQRWAD